MPLTHFLKYGKASRDKKRPWCIVVDVADRVEQHGVVVALDGVEGDDGGAEARPLLVLPHHPVQRAHEEGVLGTVR